jgi:hypothetical protein
MAATYTPIASITLGAAAASITFSSIPGTYTDLVMVAQCISTSSGTSSSIGVQFNNDTATNYSRTLLYGDGSTAASTRDSSAIASNILYYEGNTNFAPNILNIMNYANTTTNKTFIARANFAGSTVRLGVGLWRSTAAITSITILPSGASSFASGSTFNLYGILGANA